ncbi:peroxide stress protein YaaA [Ancylomarina sp. 16SWW S1-10-2]|uniref:peroxide stress protein YaaA n=1 Tax=Ancylomarina sp. 16SWW S1-10-2 TaxID=2499681 RepID=UPI0012AD4889|nr:peroxide stress protein YaaA [Ancylomarina sp. 16SWW S1-10-2]MRT91845.1 peroxide stress protein YaaA [Ancylomarina sp. 16SWW S1-10-2]
MLILISPAKSLDFETQSKSQNNSEACFLKESQSLIKQLRKLSIDEIAEFMSISPNLAQLNFERFLSWQLPFNMDNAKQAILAFKGEVYTSFDVNTLKKSELDTTQANLRILSGLYGLLKPFDLIQAYRLEMGKKLQTTKGKNLYEFWGDKITNEINKTLKEKNDKYLINLASNEYFKSVNKKKLEAEIITPVFKDLKNGKYKVVSFFAKKARGLMTRFIIQNEITDHEHLKAFNSDGYIFNPHLSNNQELVFTRDQ